jgi:hypothetical protein
MFKSLNKFLKVFLSFALVITGFQFSSINVNADTAIPIGAQYQLNITITSTSSNGTQIKLKWPENQTSKKGYYIQRKTDFEDYPLLTSLNYASYGSVTSTSSVTDYAYDYIYGDPTGHRYTYRIIAVDSSGNPSVYTNEVAFSVSDVDKPATLTLNPVSDSEIDLSWTYPSSGSFDTVIERRIEGIDTTWYTVTTVPKNTTTFKDTGLTQNTSYYYRIRAISNNYVDSFRFPSGVDELVSSTYGYQAYTKIATPTDLYGYAAQSNVIKLTWNNNATGIQTVIERKKRSEQDFSVVGAVYSDSAAYSDTIQIVVNTSYIYRIKSKDLNKNNYSDYSSEITVVNNHIDGPTNLTATTNNDSDVELRWKDNSTVETGFEIWRKQGASGNWVNYGQVGKNVTQYVDRDASKDILYFYKIRANIIYTGAFSAFSNETKTWTSILNPPTELKATSTSLSSVTLTWKDNANNEIGYAVERKVNLDGSWIIVNSSLSSDSTRFSDYGLSTNTRYYYRVKVYDNAFFNSYTYSDIILVSTLTPSVPINLIANIVSPSSVGLKWTDTSSSETGFRIEKKLGMSGMYYQIAELGPNVTSYIDKTVSQNSKYYYRVRAVNNNFYSGYSKEIFVATGKKTAFKDIKTNFWAKDAIESLAGMGVFNIANGANFYPNTKITRGEFTSYLVKAFKLKTASVGSFADVKSNHKYYKEIMIANRRGIVTQSKANNFYPERFITREEMAVLIVKVLKSIDQPLPAHDIDILNAFSDKELASTWAVNSLATVIGEGIMQGKTIKGNQVMGPQTIGVRVEAVMIIYRALNR